MRLSILILTHCRPELFKRCLASVLANLPNDVEVIVNNDSRDIIEVEHPRVHYWYQTYDTISEIYEFLLAEAKGTYVYYLEDDDYINPGFMDVVLDADLICGNYMPTYTPNNILDYAARYTNAIMDTKTFVDIISVWHLQLSQHIFKRDTIADFDFTKDNNVHNDIRLVLHAAHNSSTIKTLSKVLYSQTIDGKDNISFEGSNSTLNTSCSLTFLKDYGLQDTTTYTARPRSH